MKIQCHGGLYDGLTTDDEFPFATRDFLIREEPRKVINIDRSPRDRATFVTARYELAKTISGRLVYVPVNFYVLREDDAETGAVPGAAGGGDAGRETWERPAD